MKIILLNGPPRCGKDTVGNMMVRMIPSAYTEKFADPLKEATNLAVLALGRWESQYGESFESVKDSPDIPEFRGVTPRQAYIQMSESWAKKLWGPGFFGELLVERMKEWTHPPQAVIVTDCGFLPEVQEVIDAFPDDVELIHIVRPGCSFDGDSRDYVFPGNPTPITLLNDGSLNALRTSVAGLLEFLDIPCEETQPK